MKLWSQENELLVNGEFKNLPLSEFILVLEKSHNLNFYFLEQTIANKSVNINFKQTPVKECLEQIAQQTMLNFYIEGNNVYVFSGPPIKQDFNEDSHMEIDAFKKVPVNSSLDELRKQEFVITTIGVPGKSNRNMVTLSGVVKSFDYKSPIVDGNVIVAGTNKGASTNMSGAYELLLEKGNHTIQFSSIGMKPTQRMINIYSNGELNVEMETQIMLIGNVDIFGDKQETVTQVRSGVERMDEQMIKSLPALMGEPDVMKTTLMMPGVQTVGEGASGFNVRGGKTDQNLILVDNAPLYYPSHFFGNFSAINSDMVKETILYKGSIPSRFGGRISSVYEINTKDGSSSGIKGAGGISPLSVRAMVEGPIHKKSTFVVSTRSTYSDYILDLIKIPDLYNSQVSFNDIQAKLNFRLSEKDELKLGYYSSNDKYKLHSDTLYKYNNRIGTIKYNHKYNDQWRSEVALFNSFFAYNISSEQDLNKSFFMTHDVQNSGLKIFNEYKKNQDFSLNFGAEFNWYNINPGNLNVPDNSSIIPFKSEFENAGEFGTFAGIEFRVTP
ncbi:MAG TPA: carboxypeptidase-like regulatory domain-containing protein, partial [Draconibacterium sp.]|nr:carboxypeptidase-like regulatory domain-containing protein [Draconibacterium sp.]